MIVQDGQRFSLGEVSQKAANLTDLGRFRVPERDVQHDRAWSQILKVILVLFWPFLVVLGRPLVALWKVVR